MNSGASNRMLSAEETAELIGVVLFTFYKRSRDWELPGYKIGGKLKFRERKIDH